ncbi:galactoside alpha-(1,2)-fucosyltransferase 2-like [Penaeus chinensis]|uniref:galactoside alpha-(1,2)-fucosyltransferase 2-like n=1 Tax=Penaeus chinensis TaxID=139456 RepID=UPI001FB71BD3|nr:galactoside alpha-(1,2)-fucosyltransferase 2-like [Penaeus chinensis]
MITRKHLFVLSLSLGFIYVIKNNFVTEPRSEDFTARIRPVTPSKKTRIDFEKMGNLTANSPVEEAAAGALSSVQPSHLEDTAEMKYYEATRKVMQMLQNKAFESSKNYINNMIKLVNSQGLLPNNSNHKESIVKIENKNPATRSGYKVTKNMRKTSSPSAAFQNIRRNDTAEMEALLKSKSLPAPRSLERPLLAVADADRVRHNSTWHGYTKPIIVFKPLGRLGNVMGVYASVWAVARAYDANVFMESEVEEILRPVFPRLSMSTLPVKFVGGSWVYLIRGGPDLTDYRPLQEAAAGLRGDRTFMVDEYPFEMQIFNAYREDILKEFTFSLSLQSQAQQFLRSVTNSSGNFVGVHVRRTDYPAFLKKTFRSAAPGEDYLRRALLFYRSRLPGVTFVAASDDPDYLREVLGAEEDVVLAPGSPRELDLAALASCNHSITTGGSFGFWAAYLAGGAALYPDFPLDQYYFSRPFYERAGLRQFIPLAALRGGSWALVGWQLFGGLLVWGCFVCACVCVCVCVYVCDSTL